jgi:Ca-activated chloride channel family protein
VLVFAHPYAFFITVPLLAFFIWYRIRFYKPMMYNYPLAHWFLPRQHTWLMRHFFFALRFLSLLLLSFLIAQPQLVDVSSTVHGQGVAIMVVLDLSGSMACVDDPNNQAEQTRLDIAKEEAIRFIEKRHADQIGLVIFGTEAVSRVPLTLDKKILKEVVGDLYLGVIPEDGTVLSRGMILAASRLQQVKAASKVMIVLTDGQPSPQDDAPQAAVAIAQKLGIKIYTIGIGGDVGYQKHPLFGLIPTGSSLNKELLRNISAQTGGRFFEARRQHELRAIYDQIDNLEKSSYTTTVLSNYRDIFIPFVWLIIGMTAMEIIVSTFVWSLV